MLRILRFCVALPLLLAACSGPAADPTPTAAPSAVSPYQIVVAANDFETGTPRIPIIIYDGVRVATEIAAIEVAAFDLSQENPVAAWRGNAVNYTDYDVPYWTILPATPTAGIWGIGALLTRSDGSTAEAQFSIQVDEVTQGPDIGVVPPASENRTAVDVADLGLLTSDPNPDARLYQETVAEAMASDRPTVVMFATPAFCQTAVCAPVVNTLKGLYDTYGARVNLIHLEIYKEFNPLVVADEVTAWGLISEPWTFVLDKDGVVVDRLGGPVSPRELSGLLDGLLGGA